MNSNESNDLDKLTADAIRLDAEDDDLEMRIIQLFSQLPSSAQHRVLTALEDSLDDDFLLGEESFGETLDRVMGVETSFN